MYIKPFEEYFNGKYLIEYFNDNKAKQFNLPYQISRNKNQKMNVFYINLKSPLNLYKFLISYKKDSREVLGDVESHRGIIFVDEKQKDDLFIFITTTGILHQQLSSAIDKSNDVPKLRKRYSDLYNDITFSVDENDEFGNIWCFPFFYTRETVLTNLDKSIVESLNDQKNIKSKFLLSDRQYKDLIE